ncbi:Short-chain dehydrogenase/reductase SDR [Macrophomina phaseolina MS6]|uniref:Short-chain dehydrogenase/reductase SDR n=1 Tax=Macrophomina phaseolina (strain MS6) TaxID=1126212 RepID=K2QIQ5_MACPH|nr:Short-chain dehydrogenase/reductase SDR [Macrophomina phaseolina MS6]
MLFSRTEAFDPDQHIPDLSGKVILVTGGNNGLGKENVRQLAKHHPSKLYLGARNEARAQGAISEIKREIPDANIVFLEIDLASFSSINKAARRLLSENDRLDILVNNAGVFATPPGLSEDGYEIQFGTNYMGTALLTRLLIPLLERTASLQGADVRVVSVSSALHMAAPNERLLLSENKTTLESIGTMARYGQSKLAMIYWTRSMANEHPAIKFVAVHPGVVRTGLEVPSWTAVLIKIVGRFFLSDVSTGALNQLWASVAPSEKVRSGAMYYPVAKEFDGRTTAADDEMAGTLWKWTESEFNEKGF